MKNKFVLLAWLLLVINGCGYSNKVVLPYKDAQTIAVPTFQNVIPPTHVFNYVAGLEMSITQNIIDDLARDGNLKVVDEKNADLILRGKIIDYVKEPYRFNRFEQVEQFRVFIITRLQLEDAKTGKVIWVEKNFSGDTQYFLNGPRFLEEEEAAHKAVADLSEKIVNRVVEDW